MSSLSEFLARPLPFWPANRQVFDASGSFTVPAGITKLWLTGSAPGGAAGTLSGGRLIQLSSTSPSPVPDEGFFSAGQTIYGARQNQDAWQAIDFSASSPAWTNITPIAGSPDSGGIFRDGHSPIARANGRTFLASHAANNDSRLYELLGATAQPMPNTTYNMGGSTSQKWVAASNPRGDVIVFGYASGYRQMYRMPVGGVPGDISTSGITGSSNAAGEYLAYSNDVALLARNNSSVLEIFRCDNFSLVSWLVTSFPGSNNETVRCLAHLGDGNFLMATQNTANNTRRIYRLTNFGATCTQVYSESTSTVDILGRILVLPSGVILVPYSQTSTNPGFYRSTDGGASFTKVGFPVSTSSSLSDVILAGGIVYAHINTAVYRYNDAATPSADFIITASTALLGFDGMLGNVTGSGPVVVNRIILPSTVAGDLSFGSLLRLKGGGPAYNDLPGLGGSSYVPGFVEHDPPISENQILYPGRNGATPGTGGGAGGGTQFAGQGITSSNATRPGSTPNLPGSGAPGPAAGFAGGAGGESVVRSPVRVTPGQIIPVTIGPAPAGARSGQLVVEW